MENPLLELQEYENLQEALKKAKGPVQATGTLDSQKVHLMHWLGKDGGFSWKLVVTYDDQRAREIYDDFRSFTENVWLYPAKDLLFYSADIHGNLMTRRMAAPDGRGRRRGRHYAGRSYGSSAAFSIFKAAGSDCGKWSGHGSG